MDMFSPEIRENIELYREQRTFSPNLEKALQDQLNAGHESFPDLVVCPMPACKTPVTLTVNNDTIELHCTNCDWQCIIKKQNSQP